MTSSQTNIYHVHIYREMRLYFSGITAASAEVAAHLAAEKPTHDAEAVEDCEGETIAALVDVNGDAEYAFSRIVDFEPAILRKTASALLAALSRFEIAWRRWADDMRGHPEMSESCEMFSIYEQARSAINQATNQ
jgi:hypothetical protein